MRHKYLMRQLFLPLPGFSLIELAIVLIIIGILAGAIFKGQEILEAAKIQSVLNDINRISTATTLYREAYNQWPGNDSQARSRFGDSVSNGSGNGLISGEELNQFWVHLGKAEYLPGAIAPSSKLGGQFSIEVDPATRKTFLILSGPEKSALLTPKQASSLKGKAGETDPLTGQIQVIEGSGVSPGSCIHEGVFHLATKTPACILRVALQ